MLRDDEGVAMTIPGGGQNAGGAARGPRRAGDPVRTWGGQDAIAYAGFGI